MASRLNAPISKKSLSSSLEFRQFISNKKRYIGTVVIVVLLTFFMITMSVLGVSVVFSLVVVMMFCKKAFLQERRDIGIYKSLGFTSRKLRLQFAVRFLIVSLIGSALDSLLSVLFTEKLLTVVFKMVGIASFNTEFTPMAFIIPIAIIAVSFLVFSYLSASKIKKVEIKELVVE